MPSDREYSESCTTLHGARCVTHGTNSAPQCVEIEDERIVGIGPARAIPDRHRSYGSAIDLTGYLLMPGLINAHDHLQYALHPQLGHGPYQNYVEWGADIHATMSTSIATYQAIPRDTRLWWGGIRNLLCGVTTVCHHDKLWPAQTKWGFPVKVLERYGWGHSVAHGGDLSEAYANRPADAAFLIHACEGIDRLAREELYLLDRLGLLKKGTVLIHGLALDRDGVALLRRRQAGLIVCPSSNAFLFRQLPAIEQLYGIEDLSLGNDSPLTAMGDLLDEIRFAMVRCCIPGHKVYQMVTDSPARLLRLQEGEGSIQVSGAADLVAIRDNGHHIADRMHELSREDVELVVVRGEVRLASDAVWERLPMEIRFGMEPLRIGRSVRWLRAPVSRLLREAEAVLGAGNVRLGRSRVGSVHTHEATAWMPRGA